MNSDTNTPQKRKRRPRDVNELAALVVAIAVGDVEDVEEADADEEEKNPAAVALGRLGGKKGGKARAEKLTPEERKAIAQKAAKVRWDKED